MVILEILKLATEYLKKKNIESYRLNAELLLSSVMKMNRVQIYTNYDKPLKNEEVVNYRDCLRRRANGEPLQYIIGEVDFYNLKLKIDKRALIPRPETELLVENIIETGIKFNTILDVGTGSGNISIALAKHFYNSNIHALDISMSAIALATENAIIHNLKNIQFLNTDVFLYPVKSDYYDLIVSNPPYISQKESKNISKEITDHEPSNALFVDDEYCFYKFIIPFAYNSLRKAGFLFFEMGKGQSEKIFSLMLSQGYKNIKIIKDFQGIDRIIYGEK